MRNWVAVIQADGKMKKVTVNTKNIDTELTSLQNLVGGQIEPITLWFDDCRYIGLVNEDGMILKLPENIKASAIYSGGRYPVFGDLIILPPTDTEVFKYFDEEHATGILAQAEEIYLNYIKETEEEM